MSQPPIYRPVERFWPYADLSENPSDEELAALDPDLRAALVGAPALPFSLTVVFPASEGENYARALEIAPASSEHREIGTGDGVRTAFQLTKRYGVSFDPYFRPIEKPVTNPKHSRNPTAAQ